MHLLGVLTALNHTRLCPRRLEISLIFGLQTVNMLVTLVGSLSLARSFRDAGAQIAQKQKICAECRDSCIET